ncbi:MAG: hypothetical protein WBD40_11570 [Tepidisphaeraceae bacterium]
MFKALLAASLAMLVCCAAAAWAGTVEPIVAPAEVEASPVPFDVRPPGLADFEHVTFSPEEFRPYRSADVPVEFADVTSPAQTVIPLPVPLYAGAALLVMSIFARRKFLRAS